MPQAGIYQIVNRDSGRRYIGASVNVSRRWIEHRSKLRRGLHVNHSLQHDWDLYGERAFAFEILQTVESQEQLLTAEEGFILATANPYNQNERGGTGPRAGYRHTAEARRKMSMALRGMRKSVAHRLAIARARRGHRDSEATKAKRVASYKLAVARRKADRPIAVGI